MFIIKNNSKGVAILELLVILFLILIFIIMSTTNIFWFEEGVIKQIKAENYPGTEIKLIKSERNSFSFSRFRVMEDGKVWDYCLDTNIFFNYKIFTCE
jgi:hypothetical protein